MKSKRAGLQTLEEFLYADSVLIDPPLSAEQVLDRENEILRTRGLAVETSRPTVALALSGGGIRSATFNLGLLSAIAGAHSLRRFTYISSVSGGSYIAGWLVSWIRRKGLTQVEEGLAAGQAPGTVQPPEVDFLRQYSNYLTPRVGGFSLDTWAMIAIYCRNLTLTLSVIVAVMACALLVPRFVIMIMRKQELARWFSVSTTSPFAAASLYLAVAVLVLLGLTWYRYRKGKLFKSHLVWALFISAHLCAYILFFGGFSRLRQLAITISGWTNKLLSGTPESQIFTTFCFLVVAGAVYLTVQRNLMKLLAGLNERMRKTLRFLVGVIALVTFLFLCAQSLPIGDELLATYKTMSPSLRMIFNFTVRVVIILSCGITFMNFIIGIAGKSVMEYEREALGRLSGEVLMLSVKWSTLCVFALLAPYFLYSLSSLAQWLFFMLAWLGPTALSIALVFDDTPFRRLFPESIRNVALTYSPYLFLAGILTFLSWTLSRFIFAIKQPFETGYADAIVSSCTVQVVWYMALFSLTALAFSAQFGVNQFSLHLFYRNRLIRAYLGASNSLRRAGKYSGFDEDDDLKLTDLAPAAENETGHYDGPYPLFNTCLNLVRGDRLAWQERKAANFVFSPLYCGYDTTRFPIMQYPDLHPHAFRPTASYAYPGGVSLGTTMALSGAAISTSMGYHTSARTGFLMAAFNVRLGWWLSNPRHVTSWNQPGPRSRINMLWQEFTGGTTDIWPYIYLSDGGHFENLGIYELVRRKVSLIIASDASCDPDYTCSELGRSIERCRADFGTRIEIDTKEIHKKKVRLAIGTIGYGADRPPGILVYVKPVIIGTEPADLISHWHRHKVFPHDSTANQWFMESHFESYRVLGQSTGRELISALAERMKLKEYLESDYLCSIVEQAWLPTNNEHEGISFGAGI